MKKLFLTISLLLGLLLNAQVGITVTTDIKQANGDLFQNYTVNSIRVFGSVPKSFAGPSKNYQRTDGYQHLHDSIHFNDGFKNVVTPSYDIATEKLGAIVDQDSIFTYPVLPKTQQEIDDHAQAILDVDAASQFFSKRKADGEIYLDRFDAYVYRQVVNGQITKAQAVAGLNFFHDALKPLERGYFELSNTRVNALATANPDLLALKTKILNELAAYLSNEE